MSSVAVLGAIVAAGFLLVGEAPRSPAGVDRRRRIPVALRPILVGVLAAAAAPVLAVPAVLGALGLPWWRGRREAARRDRAERDAVAGVLDVVVIALRAGLLPGAALSVAAAAAPEGLADVLRRGVDRMARGLPVAEALQPLTGHDDLHVRHLAAELVAVARLGVPVADAAARLADEARAEHRSRVQARVQRLPVLLAGPLVGCLLPAFCLLIVAPMVLAALAAVSM